MSDQQSPSGQIDLGPWCCYAGENGSPTSECSPENPIHSPTHCGYDNVRRCLVPAPGSGSPADERHEIGFSIWPHEAENEAVFRLFRQTRSQTPRLWVRMTAAEWAESVDAIAAKGLTVREVAFDEHSPADERRPIIGDEWGRPFDWHHTRTNEPHPAQPDTTRLYRQGGTGQWEAPCLHLECAARHEVVVAVGSNTPPAPSTPVDERPRINCAKTAFRTENHEPHEHAFNGKSAWCRGLDMPALRTPPPVSPPVPERLDDALRGLVSDWSNRAARERRRMLSGCLDAADSYEACAEELADLLAAADREDRA